MSTASVLDLRRKISFIREKSSVNLLTYLYPPRAAGVMGPIRSVYTSSIGPSVLCFVFFG